MDPWPAFIAAVLDRYGVADVELAASFGITANRFRRRTRREGWSAPAPGVRVHPRAPRTVQRKLLILEGRTRYPLAASQETAAWLHGLDRRPPPRLSVLTSHATRLQAPGIVVQRARWLSTTDVVRVDGVPTLDPPALFVTVASALPERLWPWLIDAVHRRLTTPQAVLRRLDQIGAVRGGAKLRRDCDTLTSVRLESVFQDMVARELEARGFRPERSTRRIATADGVGLEVDVPLPIWYVAVEPDGDAFHRTREQRRMDRRRAAAFAGTGWVRVPVDWRDWALDRGRVLAAIRAAVEMQRQQGIGRDVQPPLLPKAGTRDCAVAAAGR